MLPVSTFEPRLDQLRFLEFEMIHEVLSLTSFWSFQNNQWWGNCNFFHKMHKILGFLFESKTNKLELLIE